MAYDALKASHPTRAEKEYLAILHLAAMETESGVDDALRVLLGHDGPLTAAAVEELVRSGREIPPATEVRVEPVDLSTYDLLLATAEVAP